MNPWMWLLFVAASVIVLGISSAIVLGVIDGIRGRKTGTCEVCGHVNGSRTAKK